MDIIKYLKSVNLLNGGYALDLGCGGGKLSKELLKEGYNVDAVDYRYQAPFPGILAYEGDVREFPINKDFYDLIVAQNVLQFLSREEIDEMVAKMYAGLKSGGIMYIALFGTKDPWNNEENAGKMTFLDNLVIPGKLIYGEESFGLGKKMDGGVKDFHCHRYVVQKD